MGQKRHWSEIRRIDGAGRRAAVDQNSGKTSARVENALTTAGGATVETPTEYSESRAITMDSIRNRLWGELVCGKYLIHERTVYIGRARGFGRGAYWALIPNLTAIASDPLHSCIEVESCPGERRRGSLLFSGKYAAGSRLLIRRISR